MNFKLRFIILATVNCGLLFVLFYLLAQGGDAVLHTRLIDLQLSNSGDRTILFQFITFMLVAFGANFVIGVGKTSYSENEIEAMIEIVRHSR